MAMEKKIKPVKKDGAKACPAEEFHNELANLFNNYKNKRESLFKHSNRWNYLKEELLKEARRGKKRITVKNTDKEFGSGKSYAEWEIELFTDEYELTYCFDIDTKNSWRVYWF